jgi:carboxylate-amine ligase
LDNNFGSSTPYSVGIEEEYQILDPDNLELVSGIEAILSAFAGEVVRPRIKPELLQSAVEATTKIAGTVAEAVEDLADLRDRLHRVAAEQGALIASAGTHPFSRYEHQDVTARRRYAEIAESLGWPAERQLVFGLHIHVGVSSPEKAIACVNGVRSCLPELLALSANSPFWQGRPTGHASTRIQVVDELPRSGIPPTLSSFGEFRRLAGRGVETGSIRDYTYIWWDVRPHPALGTVEVRICDAQTRVENVAAIAALVQSLVATFGSDFETGERPRTVPHLLVEENRRRAALDGLRAQLIDFDSDAERPAPDAIRALVEHCSPAAEALGCDDELAGVEQIITRGTGADEQLHRYDESGSLLDVARWLVQETVPQPLLR